MDTAHDVAFLLRLGDWAASVDLRDAYFHTPLHPKSRRYLCFGQKKRRTQSPPDFRIHHKLGEIQPGTESRLCLPRSNLERHLGPHLPSAKATIGPSMLGNGDGSIIPNMPLFADSSWSHDLVNPCSSSNPTVHSPSPMGPRVGLQVSSGQQSSGQADSRLRWILPLELLRCQAPLSASRDEWVSIGAPPFVLSNLKDGYSLPFLRPPPQSSMKKWRPCYANGPFAECLRQLAVWFPVSSSFRRRTAVGGLSSTSSG